MSRCDDPPGRLGALASTAQPSAIERAPATEAPRTLPGSSPRQSVTAAYVADVCRRYPSERDAILKMLLSTRGPAFLQQVLAIPRTEERPQRTRGRSPRTKAARRTRARSE
jgi:hypothetical protein